MFKSLPLNDRRTLAFSLLMAFYMSFLMSGILTALNTGVHDGFVWRWLRGFLIGYACAFPLAWCGAPAIRALVGHWLPDPEHDDSGVR